MSTDLVDALDEWLEKATYALGRLAENMWLTKGHELGTWKDVTEPFLGRAMRCPQCGECVVVQGLLPNKPMAMGFAINMLPGTCGDRVYVDIGTELELEVWL
jgi:hypothetical protein